MPSPQLHVETISFQDHGSAALPLLVGGVRISPPEWTRTGTRLPAALVASEDERRISIAASFSSPELAGQTVTVSAARPSGAGRIQNVEPEQVTFDGLGQTGRISFVVAMLRGGTDLDHLCWQWQFQHNGSTHDADVTEHDIAVVLGTPQAPWTKTIPPPPHTTLPRWDVLQRACIAARDTRTLPEAAAKITHAVFAVWSGSYYRWQDGAETFASDSGDVPPAFDCDRFLALLDAPPPLPKEIVDCSDVATIVSTFAAILGCPVEQLTLFRELRCNILKKVGHDSWETGLGFPLHEVAVSVPLAPDPLVWDGCVMLSGDATIGSAIPTIALLPAGIAGSEYLRRLLSANGIPFGSHIRRGPLTRPIQPLSNVLGARPGDEFLEAITALNDIGGWPVPVPRVVRTLDPKSVAGDGWSVLVETSFPSPESVPADADAVARMVCVWLTDPRRRVRVTVYLCVDPGAARRRLLYLLEKFPPPLTRLDGGDDVAFGTPDLKVIVGTTMNVAYKMIDVGETPDVSGPDAARVTSTLTKELASASQPL